MIIIFNYLVGHLGFSAAEALIPGVIQGFTNIVAAGVAIAVLPRIGGWAGMCYGLVISVIEGASESTNQIIIIIIKIKLIIIIIKIKLKFKI